MLDQYFGVKELYEVVLRAKGPMKFGDRNVEDGEPVLYFENISMSLLTQQAQPIMARGGWANLPRVIWEDRSEVTFTLSEGVMSSISMGILLSANVTNATKEKALDVSKREGPFTLVPYMDGDKEVKVLYLMNEPVLYPEKKTFIFEYARDVAQKKVYGKIVGDKDELARTRLAIFEDKACEINADENKQYIVDYYYKYNNDALLYTIEKERFNGLFTLEGKFYSKDENDGLNYTNLIYMPKVRVVSDISLRLGERADPTVSVFNIIGLPENTGNNRNGLIMEITRLSEDIE